MAGNTYAVTISPPCRPARCTYLYDDDYIYINRFLGRMCFTYRLYPEFKDGRLHYHGLVYDLDLVKYNATKYKIDRLGFSIFKKIKDEDNYIKWTLYCLKEWEHTQKIFLEFHEEVQPMDKIFRIKRNTEKQQQISKSFDDYTGFTKHS